MTISAYLRAARERRLVTPPRRRTASCKPPPTATRSRKKRKASNRFDLPDAFGPTRKTRCGKVTAILVKLRQLRSATCVKRHALALCGFVMCVSPPVQRFVICAWPLQVCRDLQTLPEVDGKQL